MNLWERLTLVVLEEVANRLELCLVDYQNGGFLPPEKRAFPIDKQVRVAILAKKAANLKVLDLKPTLREKILILSGVLNGTVMTMPAHLRAKGSSIRRG